jgi:hypothetical protein
MFQERQFELLSGKLSDAAPRFREPIAAVGLMN